MVSTVNAHYGLQVLQRKIDPVFKPVVKDILDVSNFDSVFTKEEAQISTHLSDFAVDKVASQCHLHVDNAAATVALACHTGA